MQSLHVNRQMRDLRPAPGSRWLISTTIPDMNTTDGYRRHCFSLNLEEALAKLNQYPAAAVPGKVFRAMLYCG
jgi:hypothetical protein